MVTIMTLVNLENTFKASSGYERWRIKYMFFSIIAVLIFYVYVISQRILFYVIDIRYIYMMSTVTITADIMIIYSIFRNRIIDNETYISRDVIYRSVSLIAIGLYSIIVALVAQLIKSYHINTDLKLNVLIIFFASLFLVVVYYKESFRRKLKAIINKHFGKSKYVYRDEWIVFSKELSKKVSTGEVCEILLKTLSERLFVNKLSLWLYDEIHSGFFMACAHNLSIIRTRIKVNDKVLQYLHQTPEPLAIYNILGNEKLQPLSREVSILLSETKAELLVPLKLADRWVGLLTLGKVLTGELYDVEEDYDLLKSVAAHASSAINSARLFEKNLMAREMEAFNRFSCFVMHDLKNATSMLSMVAQNAKEHLRDPEFQKDALQSILGAVEGMKKIIANLSALPDELDLKLTEQDLNALIHEAVENMVRNGSAKVMLEKDLKPVPKVRIDAGEMQKVLENLFLNACEAVDGNGPGMSREFMENSLFRPFQSTKRNGLGIGLYQCKSIVEAHDGRLEAESAPGIGSKFSVYLPAQHE
jgi:putative PEP-CTERM system histidine kinase